MQLPPPVHGASTMNQIVADSEVVASQFERSVIGLRFADSVADLGRPALRKVLGATVVAMRLAEMLVRRRPDLVYLTLTLEGGAFYRDCIYVALIKLARVPHAFHLHMQPPRGPASRLVRWAVSRAHVIELAPGLGREVARAGRSVLVVANGIADVARPRTRGPGTPPRVLFLSHLSESKGPLVLLDALAALAARGVRCHATFAGADGGCLAKFEARVRELGLAGVVAYAGPVYGEAKSALFATHDLFVLPSSNEAFPLVILEAMMWSLPIVATSVGAVPAIAGDAAMLVPVGDADALAGAIETYLLDPGRRTADGARGRARFLEHYTRTRFETDLTKALQQCLA